MKASNAARPAVETAARILALEQQAAILTQTSGESMTAEACLRVEKTKFTLLQIFGTIILDLFLTIGPLVPTFYPPETSCNCHRSGVNLLSFVLPKSASYTVLASLRGTVDLMENLIVFFDYCFTTRTEQLESESIKPARVFLPIDFSRGRWSAEDVVSLRDPIQKVIFAGSSLLDFHIGYLQQHETMKEIPKESVKPTVGNNGSHSCQGSKLDKVFQNLSYEGYPLVEENMQALKDSSSETLPACQGALSMISECFHAINSTRWLGKYPTAALENLQRARAASASQLTERLLDTYPSSFDDEGNFTRAFYLKTPHPLQGLMIGMVFKEEVLTLVDAMIANRLPRGIRLIISWASRSDDSVPDQFSPSDPDTKQGLFALGMVAVTIAHGVPAVIPSTQTTLIVYMSDFVFSIICLVAWYIGSGHGSGNPHELGAIMAVVVIILMHISSYENPGSGYSVFWSLILSHRQLIKRIAEEMGALIGPIALLNLEFSSSDFDSKSLASVAGLSRELNQALSRLLSLSSTSPLDFQEKWAKSVGMLDQRDIDDIMVVITVIQFRDENYRRYCVAFYCYVELLVTFDKLVFVVKERVGEMYMLPHDDHENV
ncbi:uncharacterized protein BP01DRAFT_376225 [Aspergillus saccharolyticus JOP 1030-1]|uniref:Uncharacterized protein n=1 Tax=Aspergillus saccharolyticus JOP 1030-1 TaxID=1450539 RepID=A0A318Z5I2_9EURO|nr:hypothetical protein BP01DRAFT_376225 [Aspergillus saccharolyticus JOP 1030-1]PYH42571.1 hypothetical protein BP01DRAFT_376225 [Aspergillus saccharolyticus JOP 1030-1]